MKIDLQVLRYKYMVSSKPLSLNGLNKLVAQDNTYQLLCGRQKLIDFGVRELEIA